MSKTNRGRHKRKDTLKQVESFVPLSDHSPFAFNEAYSSLKTNLKFTALGQEKRRVIVTSALPGEGKTSVAINLALALARDDKSVLLMDCDLRKPMVGRYLRLPNGNAHGLTNALESWSGIASCIVPFAQNSLSVMPAGVLPPNPPDLLGSVRMGQLVEFLSKTYDYIIFDTPPVAMMTDAAVLSQYADGIVWVVRQKYATTSQLAKAKQAMANVNANILGVVLNQVKAKYSREYDDFYGEYDGQTSRPAPAFHKPE